MPNSTLEQFRALFVAGNEAFNRGDFASAFAALAPPTANSTRSRTRPSACPAYGAKAEAAAASRIWPGAAPRSHGTSTVRRCRFRVVAKACGAG